MRPPRRPLADAPPDAGFTGLALDRAQGRYAWRGGAATGVARNVMDRRAADWQAALAQVFERHLNEPFAQDGPSIPSAFSSIDGGRAFFLGIAYDHFIAGGDSIVVLLNAIADRYAGRPGSGDAAFALSANALAPLRPAPWRFVRGIEPSAGDGRKLPQHDPAALPSLEDGRNVFHVLHARCGGASARSRRRQGLGRHAQRRV